MTDPDQSPAPSPDLDAIAAQTQSAALALLEPPALKALQADLRAMKESAADEPMRKTLAKAVQRIAAEKRRRKGDAAEPAPGRAAKPGGEAGKAERQRVKEAEKAEKQRVKELEKAERKAARHAARAAGKQAAKPKGKPAGDKPPAGADKGQKQAKPGGGAGKGKKPE